MHRQSDALGERVTIRDGIEIAPPQSGNSRSARLRRWFAVDMRGAPPPSTNRCATSSECFMLQQ
jgi:hypothetical protein